MVSKTMLIGRVGANPEIRNINNSKLARFTMATDEFYRDKNGEKVNKVEWHTIVAWKGLADIIEKIVKKGTLVFVEGKIRNKTWTDGQGIKRYSYEIEIFELQVLSSKQDNDSYSQSQSNQSSMVPNVENVDTETGEVLANQDPTSDDLPF